MIGHGPEGNAARGPRWAVPFVACALALAIGLAYAGSLSGGFVFDDVPAIVENPTIRPPLSWATVVPPGEQAGTVGGRPVVNLSLAFNYALGGLAPAGYHALNLAIHLCAALLLFGLVRRTLRRGSARSPSPAGEGIAVEGAGNRARSIGGSAAWSATEQTAVAAAVALLWALHPMQTEAVTYVIQRAESLMGLFYLLTLYGFVRALDANSRLEGSSAARGTGRREIRPFQAGAESGKENLMGHAAQPPVTRRSRRLWLGVSGMACLLGMATKEVMVSAPLLVLLYDRTFAAGSFGEAWRRRRGYYLALAATWVPLALLVAGTVGRGGSAGFAASAGIWPYLLTQCRALVLYLRLAAWPHPLVFDYGTTLIHAPGAVLGDAVFVLLLLAGTVVALWRAPVLGFLGAWFFAILAPSSSFIPIATEPIAEHRMYLPLAAVIALATVGGIGVLRRLNGMIHRFTLARRFHEISGPAAKSEAKKGEAVALTGGWRVRADAGLSGWTLPLLGVCGVAVAYFGMTASRNRVYRSALALWADTAAEVPGNPRAHNDLGTALRQAGKVAAAEAEFGAAVAADPDYAPAQFNLGVELLDAHRPAEALPHLQRALSAPLHQAELRLYLGQALLQLGRPANATAYLREAAKLAPRDVETEFQLGNALAEQQRYAEAADAFRLAVQGAPDKATLRNNLANALLFAGRVDEAIDEYRRALALSPHDTSIRGNLEMALRVKAAGAASR